MISRKSLLRLVVLNTYITFCLCKYLTAVVQIQTAYQASTKACPAAEPTSLFYMMEYIKGWCALPQNILFGHAKCSYNSLSDLDTWKEVVEGVCQKGPADVSIVGPTMKTNIARLAWHELQNSNTNLENTIKALTYLDFFKKLHGNRFRDGTGPDAWRNTQNMKAQTVVLVLDHDISADCALAMVAAVHWATDIGHLIPVRVLTISFSSAPNAFRRLLDLYAHNQPFLFEVNKCTDISEAQLASIELRGSSHLNDNLLESLSEPLNGRVDRQIIICPSSSDYDHKLPEQQEQCLSERTITNEAVEDRLAIRETLLVGERPEEGGVKLEQIVADDNAIVILRYLPGYRPPLPLNGFLQVHLHPVVYRDQIIFDSFTLQVARIRLAVSKEERLEQLSLAFRASPIPGRIKLFFEEPTLDKFLDKGPLEKLKVCNQHAGGFIIGLVCLLNWGIRFNGVVSCFFLSDSERLASRHTINVLRCQGITSHTPHGEYQAVYELRFPTALGERLVDYTSFVLALLPIVDFDYRLAAFIARHTNSSVVLKAKLQLAAILVTGIDQLFSFPSHDATAKEQSQSLVESCRGWTTALAHKGSMWMAVGLWKHSTLIDVGVNDESNPRGVKIPGTEITVNFPASLHVQKTLTSLTSALIRHYIAVFPDNIPESPMHEQEYEEIQEHLAYAYFNQTALVTLGANGHLLYQLKTGPADATSVSVPPCLIDSTHFVRLFKEDNDLQYDSAVCDNSKICGIYHGLRREFGLGVIHLDDWTYIPSKFILGLDCTTFRSSLNKEELEM